jgi:hypothetical protein
MPPSYQRDDLLKKLAADQEAHREAKREKAKIVQHGQHGVTRPSRIAIRGQTWERAEPKSPRFGVVARPFPSTANPTTGEGRQTKNNGCVDKPECDHIHDGLPWLGAVNLRP